MGARSVIGARWCGGSPRSSVSAPRPTPTTIPGILFMQLSASAESQAWCDEQLTRLICGVDWARQEDPMPLKDIMNVRASAGRQLEAGEMVVVGPGGAEGLFTLGKAREVIAS